MGNLPNRIALIYDRVNKWGGAEEVLLALHDLFPSAPLYTSVYSSDKAPWAQVFPSVIPSFLQRIPGSQTRHELFPWLAPLAFESFNFSQYDAVISVTSADAKGIITSPSTFHFCYCLTPTRYLWSHHREYSAQTPFIFRPVFNYLKHWDIDAAKRPDFTVSISNTVKQRNQKYYGLDTPVVYPPVDISSFSAGLTPPLESDYFLYLGRLVPYKRPELIVRCFNSLNKKLVIIGTGSEESRLKKIAGPNIIFKGFVSQADKIRYLQHCQALIFFHEEDFGIVPVEAQACGRPVIALNRGGARETIVPGVTGNLIDDSPAALIGAVNRFSATNYDPKAIINHARSFSSQRFLQEFVKIFLQAWTKYKSTYMS